MKVQVRNYMVYYNNRRFKEGEILFIKDESEFSKRAMIKLDDDNKPLKEEEKKAAPKASKPSKKKKAEEPAKEESAKEKEVL